MTSSSKAIKNKKLPTILKILPKMQFQVLCLSQDDSQSCGGFSTTTSSKGSISVTRPFSIMWRIFYNNIFFKRFYFSDKTFLNHLADFLQLHLLQKVLFLWHDLSQLCGRFSTITSSSKVLFWWYFSIYNYIIFRIFYFGDKIFLNYVADFLQLHLLQEVLFWWQDLSQSCGGFSTITSVSKGSIFVTRSLSIMWRIFCSYIFLRMFYFGDKQVIHHFGNWLSYPPF